MRNLVERLLRHRLARKRAEAHAVDGAAGGGAGLARLAAEADVLQQVEGGLGVALVGEAADLHV